MSLNKLGYESLDESRIDELRNGGCSRYYTIHILHDIEESVCTVEVYLRHYVQVPPLAGHLHKVEGMHLVMSLYNKLKSWQLKRKQMRDTFSDECMNEEDCKHALGLLHDVKSKVQEKLNVIKSEIPQTLNDEVSATQRSAELTKVDFEDYAAWCNDISYDPTQNPSVMPYVIHPNLNQAYKIPDPDIYYSTDQQPETATEDDVISKAGDYHSLRDSSSKLSMVEIYEHLIRIIYSMQVCFIGIWQDDEYIKLGNSISENIGPLSVYRSYTKSLFEKLYEDKWKDEIDKTIDEDLKDWCESKDLNRKKLTDAQSIDFYKYEGETNRTSLRNSYPEYSKLRSGFFYNDSNKVNVALLSHKVYHKEGAEDFIKKCLLIEAVRDRQSNLSNNRNQAKPSSKKDKGKNPYTLHYLCEDDSIRVKRIGFVRRKWEEWGWLEANTDMTDFEHFFSGKTRDCQLKWKANNAILSLLIAQLLDKKDCFGHITGCSPRSVVINQFKKSYDNHSERVDELNMARIEWTVKLLNYIDSLELPQLPFHQGEDISDNALQEIFAGNMHITKDLNKYKD